jgi:hypothetical protein
MTTRLHRSEVNHQIGRVFRAHGLSVTARDIEKHLGYPLAEAGITDLRGVIAALSAVVDACRPAAGGGGV